MEIAPVLKEAIDFYGEEHQCIKAIEELGELIKAIAKIMAPKKKTIELRENLIDGIADVNTMIEQVMYIHHIQDYEIHKVQRLKAARLRQLMNESSRINI